MAVCIWFVSHFISCIHLTHTHTQQLQCINCLVSLRHSQQKHEKKLHVVKISNKKFERFFFLQKFAFQIIFVVIKSVSWPTQKPSNYEWRLFSLVYAHRETAVFFISINLSQLYEYSFFSLARTPLLMLISSSFLLQLLLLLLLLFWLLIELKIGFSNHFDELSENQPETSMFTFRQHWIALSFFFFFLFIVNVVLLCQFNARTLAIWTANQIHSLNIVLFTRKCQPIWRKISDHYDYRYHRLLLPDCYCWCFNV